MNNHMSLCEGLIKDSTLSYQCLTTKCGTPMGNCITDVQSVLSLAVYNVLQAERRTRVHATTLP
jgi:hypothetical protein